MLKLVQPYVTYGYPSLKTVRDLLYKRGYAKVNKQRIPISDNSVISTSLGEKQGLFGMEDPLAVSVAQSLPTTGALARCVCMRAPDCRSGDMPVGGGPECHCPSLAAVFGFSSPPHMHVRHAAHVACVLTARTLRALSSVSASTDVQRAVRRAKTGGVPLRLQHDRARISPWRLTRPPCEWCRRGVGTSCVLLLPSAPRLHLQTLSLVISPISRTRCDGCPSSGVSVDRGAVNSSILCEALIVSSATGQK